MHQSREICLGEKQKSPGRGESSPFYPYAAFGERISRKTSGRCVWHQGQSQESFLMEAPVWLFFWASSLCLSLADPFKFTAVLFALSETPGTSGGVSLQQHQATSPQSHSRNEIPTCSLSWALSNTWGPQALWWWLILGLPVGFRKGHSLPHGHLSTSSRWLQAGSELWELEGHTWSWSYYSSPFHPRRWELVRSSQGRSYCGCQGLEQGECGNPWGPWGKTEGTWISSKHPGEGLSWWWLYYPCCIVFFPGTWGVSVKKKSHPSCGKFCLWD